MRILIVGSLGGQLHTATKIALDRGAKVSHVDTIEQATAHLRAGRGADLLMVDLHLDVQSLIAANDAERISVPVVACGVNVRPEAAAAAIRAGAKEFIPMPPDADLIAAVLAAIADDERPMIARDPSMQAVIHLADRIAGSDASVLITGESGSGKEVMARYVHTKSKRAQAPFISVNCAAIPENLLESELFGHEKGAFTGAIARRVGKFEEADGGTLLLDEISEMDVRLQAKLLRAIQEREIDRVGGTKPVKVNIRILATSNRDLRKAVADGSFREDLLFRLNVVNLALPPLRERPADIVALSEHFVKKYSAANAVDVRPISDAARTSLLAREWTGNVRELENAMHRAVLLATGRDITPEAIRMPDGSAFTGSGSNVVRQAADAAQSVQADMIGRTVAEVEQDLILNTLDHCFGNRTHAANILGISIRTLRNKLKLYSDQGLDIPAPNQPAQGVSVA
ncbi:MULTISPECIES: sigma-54 interaction domain-containing protein [Maricaulis]|jgi:two-component system response regulator FlrC|uniref:Two component, sigma54 specific, transcriptional regulator, Fis family n=1 Tax=Maricaulis maris (strain MCS10) TaxID=394221 RepID=Q0ARW2_MARMM|nr:MULTISPECIES: sigma-54 dependent transcriptional regulator [Maricaulis]ABI64975.1 two component, sigma54 specific, transcriptional regulator, Fis family [Maricaulis maris MCS10]MAC90922.1 sigma-54-dependent Fis family transcriptional regulator [Maricaulis sp.]